MTMTKQTETTNHPTTVLCFDGGCTYWIEDFDPEAHSAVSQVVETYDSEQEALEGLARARAQQASDGDENLSYADALTIERRDLGLVK